MTWIHILFLFAVSITPFSTKLLAEFSAYRVALLAYWANIPLLGIALYCSWLCAIDLRLVKADMPLEVPAAIKRRILSRRRLTASARCCAFSARAGASLSSSSYGSIAQLRRGYGVAGEMGRRASEPLHLLPYFISSGCFVFSKNSFCNLSVSVSAFTARMAVTSSCVHAFISNSPSSLVAAEPLPA